MADPDELQDYWIGLPIQFYTVSAICWCASLLQILGIYMFCRLRSQLIIEKRYPRLVMVEAVVTTFALTLVYPAWMTYITAYSELCGSWWPFVCVGFMMYTYQLSAVIETCRIWLISYDLQYLHSSKNQQWKTAIDASYAEKDWYLRNRGKWGNRQYIVRLGFVYYFVATTTIIAVVLSTGLLCIDINIVVMCTFAVQVLFQIVHVAVPIYLFIKTPRKLQDLFLFSYEFTCSVFFVTTEAIFGIIIAVINVYADKSMGWILSILNGIYHTMPSLLVRQSFSINQDLK